VRYKTEDCDGIQKMGEKSVESSLLLKGFELDVVVSMYEVFRTTAYPHHDTASRDAVESWAGFQSSGP
jgi:hypothetical protein